MNTNIFFNRNSKPKTEATRKFSFHVLSRTLPLCLVMVLVVGNVWGQTNPIAHNLSASNFTFTGFATGTTTTYPTSMQGHKFPAERTTSNLTDNTDGDRILVVSTDGTTNGSIRNEVANGISLLNSGSNNIGAISISVNSTGRNNLLVSWTAQQLNSGGTGGTDRINGLRLQYRIGTTGSFTDVATTEYLTTNTTSQNTVQSFSNIALPTACNNQAVVHIRWVYYISSGSLNSRDRIRLDDIIVTSTSSGTLTPPALTAASSPTVDAPFDVSFTDDPTWRGAITSITIGGTTLSNSAYTISAGQITFTPSASSLLQSSGSKSIVVIATGYNNASLTQSIGVGAPSKLSINTQPTAPSTNGGSLAAQPRIAIQDQYGNATSSSATIVASVGAGTWTLGGTTSVNAISGTTTFAGLTASSTAAVTGATITFTSTGLTSVTSSTFNIVAPAPSNDLCNNPLSLTNGVSTSGTSISATYNIINLDPYNYSSDVWFSYTSVSTSTILVSLSNSASIDYDLFAYSTNCPSSGIGIQNGGNSNASSSESMTISATQGTTYYFRVAAYNAPSGSLFTILVSQPPAPPTISLPTDINCNRFDANWSIVNTATSYKIDVSTNRFSSITSNEGFSNGISAPSGWIYTNIGGTYTSNGNFGSSSPSLQMDATNDRVQTPIFTGSISQLSFWYKGQSATGSSLLIEGYNGTSWITIQNITSLSSSAITVTYNSTSSPTLPSNLVQIRFTYTRSSGNLSFDDVNIIYDNFNYLSGYQDLSVSSTSKSISGLSPNTKYYYRVRSTDGSNTSPNSNIDSITTPALVLTTDGIIAPFCFGTATSSSLTYTAANDNPNSYSIDWNTAANTAGLTDQTATSFTSSNSGGTISSIVIPSNIVAGTYNGVMTITNAAGCSITKNVSLTINALPTITIAATPANAFVCQGSSVTLTATAGLSSYTWSSGASTTNTAAFSPTATNTYSVTGTDGNGCINSATKTVNYYPASSYVGLSTSNVSGAVEQCTESNGWTYYALPSNPSQYLFGIYKNGNTFTATVDITLDNVNKHRKSTSSNGANQEHASYIMSRYWNATLSSGSIASNSSVKVRFFIDPQDTTDLKNERDNDYNTLKNTTNPSTLAVKSSFEWFKTVGTVYAPTNWLGNTHNGTIVKLTQDATGSLNGQTYVELSGITSFSGGSGGAAFGPTSNGLFNNAGVVGLPVTWHKIDVQTLENGNEVAWSTSSEQNTSHFEVEYSDDAVQFYKVSENIPAAGNSSTTQYYKFLHESEMKPWLYYRVKQLDLDGKVDYSKIVIAKRASKLPDFKVLIYPIPLIEGDLTLDIHSIAQTEIQIRVIDLLGKEVYREKVPSKGYRTQHQLQLDHLPKGQYQIQIDNSVFNHLQRLVLMK